MACGPSLEAIDEASYVSRRDLAVRPIWCGDVEARKGLSLVKLDVLPAGFLSSHGDEESCG